MSKRETNFVQMVIVYGSTEFPPAVEHLDLAVLQEILHDTGVQPLAADREITSQQLSSVVDRIYQSLHGSRPHTQAAFLQEAHGVCMNWLLSAFEG